MSRISFVVLASFFAFFFTLTTAYGQPSVPGTATPPSLKSLNLEAVIPLANINATGTLDIPASLLSAFTNGTMELRQQLNYSATAQTLVVSGISVPAGSPMPTPLNATGVTTLWNYTVNLDRVDLTTKPGSAVVFLGFASNSSSGTPFGDISGSLVSVSTAYIASPGGLSATAFSGIATSIAGSASLFSKQGSGTIMTSSKSISGAPVAVAGPKNFISIIPQFQLDGSHSTDPNGGTLTYHWTFMPIFGTTATLVGADTATPTVTVPDYSDAQGDYTFQLMVTNAAGLSATDTVTVTYSVPVANTNGQ